MTRSPSVLGGQRPSESSAAVPEGGDATAYGLRPEVAEVLLREDIRILRPIQWEALRAGALQGASLLICAPSGSGKTLVGELVCLHQALEGRKAFLLVPLRALASERFLRLQARYRGLPVSVGISTGDYTTEPGDLAGTDISVLTYERFDWLLRVQPPWLEDLGAVVIDEIHILGTPDRGPRLESAIVRFRQRFPEAQLVGLSATIANPEDLADWLGCRLLLSQERPVELRYRVLVAPEPHSTVARLVRAVVRRGGQVLVFAPSRRETERLSLVLSGVVAPLLTAQERDELRERSALAILDGEGEVPASQERLASRMQSGVAFHHAGLDMASRRLVEDAFQRRLLKVICCTTTLGAGINTPARMVILLHPVLAGLSQNGAEYRYMDANRVHQILGRAGRPGQEALGFAVILAGSQEEAERLSAHYFKPNRGRVVPRHDPVESTLYTPQNLQEQVLVLASRPQGVSPEEIRSFFEATYWWHQQRRRDQRALDQLVRIGSTDVESLLEGLSSLPVSSPNPSKSGTTAESMSPDDGQTEMTGGKDQPSVEFTVLARDKIEGRVMIPGQGWHTCAFTGSGSLCSCRNQIGSRQLCSHLVALARSALHLYPQYAREIIPRSLKEEFIADTLLRHGLLAMREDRFYATPFGRLTVTLYLRPATALWLRRRLPSITTAPSFIEAVTGAMRFEGDSAPSGLPRCLRILAEQPTATMAQAAKAGRVEIGDLEALLHTAIWLGNAATALARLEGIPEVILIGEPLVASWQSHTS